MCLAHPSARRFDRKRVSRDPGRCCLDLAVLAALDEASQPIDGVPGVDEPRVERREPEADRVRATEVGNHIGSLDQRATELPRVDVAKRDVATPQRRLARGAELEPERREPRVVQLDDEPRQRL